MDVRGAMVLAWDALQELAALDQLDTMHGWHDTATCDDARCQAVVSGTRMYLRSGTDGQ
jgi:hypothetical protein